MADTNQSNNISDDYMRYRPTSHCPAPVKKTCPGCGHVSQYMNATHDTKTGKIFVRCFQCNHDIDWHDKPS